MQLSKLEIKGFKSFGEKVVVNFDDGVTGIVGPNGCGKSNVVDCIRWVLGEQKTSSLRSEKMEDVIFNGTKNRKAHQLAEVSITFRNTKNLIPTEYSEVTVTRRYYRSGDSEYELNGVTCRKKDITDLFMDTGIGSDSYAIIELKMVEDLLQDRNNARREMFEEAAGIAKFKVRKKQTLKKLDDTDKDLSRVEDLLYEIDKNLQSLEKQAKQAEKYFSVKADYKQKSIQLARIHVQTYKAKLEAISQKTEQEKEKRSNLVAQISTKEAELEKVKSELEKKEKLLSSRQKALNEHVSNIRQYESEKKIQNERLKYLNQTRDKLEAQIKQDKESNERAEISLRGLKADYEKLEQEVNEHEGSLQKLKAEYEWQKEKTEATRQEQKKLNEQLQASQEKVHKLSKSIEVNEVQVKSLREEYEKNTSDNSENRENYEVFDKHIKSLQDQIAQKKSQLQELHEQEAGNEEAYQQCEQEIEKIKEQITDKNRKIDAKQHEYNLTKSMVENLEGFPEAVRFLKQNEKKWTQEAPILSDVITCSEDYRVAIENFLEPYMNYYVVDEKQEAIKAVNILSESGKGKANFFILSEIPAIGNEALPEFENAIRAIEIADFDEKYKPLVYYLLGTVYILKKDQENIPDDTHYTFISQSGKIIKRKYTISGGSVGLFEGKRIGRAKNLEVLDKDIHKLNKEVEKLKQSLENKHHELDKIKQNRCKDAITALQQEINQLDQDLVAYTTKKEQLESLLQNNEDRKKQIEENIASLDEALKNDKPALEKEEAHKKELEAQLHTINARLVEEDELLNQKSATYNQENIHYHQQKNKLSSLDQEIKYKRNNYENNIEKIAGNTTELEKTDQEIKELVSKTEHNDQTLLSMYEEKESLEKGVNEAETDYYNTRGQINEEEKAVRELQKQKENADALINEHNEKLNAAKLELNGIKERISVEFDVDLDALMQESDSEAENPAEEDEAALKEKVDKLKKRLENFGPINYNAMEAYEEIKNRHQFITEQRQDLLDAKQSLMDTISEIDTTARENFMDAFNKIRDNFISVFRSLFTEDDSCDLRLSDPDNPLDSYIDIIAQPKGKKPQSINQLSGGEKTLTAISLLFAIYLLKPAPFCVFDEVDAPLDDANIDKFNNIIHEFSKQSQFILVTHNKRTMSSTDVIYGVTMAEQGISKVVPVDLRTIEKENLAET